EMRQFSTALAHELRTPIAALRGEIELAAMKPGLTEDQRADAGSQLEELDKLKRTIDQLLTLARAESGQIPLTLTRVELAPLIESVVEQLEPVAQAQGLSLLSELHATPAVEGDFEWLQRAVREHRHNPLTIPARGRRVLGA